jgi:hypothetical protein
MGTYRDIRQRKCNARIDSTQRQFRIKRARSFIFEKGVGITGKRVQDLLDEGSYVPTIASNF